MIKLTCLVQRPAGQSAPGFRSWWLDHHASVAAKLPGLRKYTISVCSEVPEGAPVLDGIAELWFDSAEAIERAFASPEGQLCAQEDAECIGARFAYQLTEFEVSLSDGVPVLVSDVAHG